MQKYATPLLHEKSLLWACRADENDTTTAQTTAFCTLPVSVLNPNPDSWCEKITKSRICFETLKELAA